MRYGIDLRSGIAVVVPDAARIARTLEDQKIVELGFLQIVGDGDTAEAAADNCDAHATRPARQHADRRLVVLNGSSLHVPGKRSKRYVSKNITAVASASLPTRSHSIKASQLSAENRDNGVRMLSTGSGTLGGGDTGFATAVTLPRLPRETKVGFIYDFFMCIRPFRSVFTLWSRHRKAGMRVTWSVGVDTGTAPAVMLLRLPRGTKVGFAYDLFIRTSPHFTQNVPVSGLRQAAAGFASSAARRNLA